LKSKDTAIKEIFMKYQNILKAYEEDLEERIEFYKDKDKENDEVYQHILKVNDKIKHILHDLNTNQE
jgi:hypothetical protein